MSSFALLFFCLAFLGEPLPGEVRVLGVETFPESVFTGDSLTLEIVLEVPAGLRVLPPDTLSSLSGARNLGSGVGRSPAASGGDGSSITLLYPLQVLRPGEILLPPLRARVQGEPAGGSGLGQSVEGRPSESSAGTWVALGLGNLVVGSVLPPDSTGVEPTAPLPAPRGAGTGALPFWALLFSAGCALGAWILGRGGKGRFVPDYRTLSTPEFPSISPGEARRRLQRILEGRHFEDTELGDLFQEAFGLLRILLQGDDPRGRLSRTSPEILASLDGKEWGDPTDLKGLLDLGDQHRFGSRPLPPDELRQAMSSLRKWVEESHA